MYSVSKLKTSFKHAVLVILYLLFNIQTKGQVNITTAIDFNVKDVESESHHLFEYLNNNKIVVLDFFTATCGPCQTYASHVNAAYEFFGCNAGNVIFLGINWGNDNDEVRLFDSAWGANYPGVSGIQGGGNEVVENYQVLSYPTVCVITPDHLIYDNYIWFPEYDSIVQVVLMAGGIPQQCTVDAKTNFISSNVYIRQLSPGKVHITLPEKSMAIHTLKIFSMEGKLVLSRTIPNSDIYDLTSILNNGFYIANLYVNQRLVGRCKLINP